MNIKGFSISQIIGANNSALFDEEESIKCYLSTFQQSFNTHGANNQTTNEQNINSSNSKKRMLCSIISENEVERPLKKLFSFSYYASSSSNTSPSQKVPAHEREREVSSLLSSSSTSSKVPDFNSDIYSSTSDYANCDVHNKYNQNCGHCLKMEQLSRELANDRIILGEKIGEGGYGTVYKGSLNNEWVAIKIFLDEDSFDDYDNEIKYLTMLKGHQNIIGYKFSKKYGKTGVIVLELMDQSLNGFLNNNQDYFRDMNNIDDLVQVVKGIASGIETLHENNIVHVDFHPGNVLLDLVNFNVKISDFGLSKIENEEDRIIGNCARDYRPPEGAGKLNGRADHKKYSDIYQFGKILLHLIHPEQIENTFEGIPDSYREMFNSCVNPNPEQRPTIKEIIRILNNW